MDPYNVLYQFPELLAAMVTDLCKDHARCRVIVKFCGKSANMTFAYTEMIERIRDAVKIYCRRKGLKTNANAMRPTVSYNVRVLRKRTYIDLDDDILTFEQLDGMPGTLTKTLVGGVELDDVVVKSELMKRGIQTYKLRKAIQKKNARNNEDYKVTPLFRNPDATWEPSLSVAQTEKLIRKYISYDDLREYYLGILHGDDDECSNGLRLGLFYDSAKSQCSYWHLPFVEEFGFGGSYSDPNFNRAFMAKWLKHLGKDVAYGWLALFVVSWIVCDGSLHTDYIIFLIAAHFEGTSKGASIPNRMEDDRLLFAKFLTPYVSNKCGLDNNDDEGDNEEEDKLPGFLPYYKWNALVDLEELYYEEGGDPNCTPDNAGAWEKLTSLDGTSW